MCHNAADDSKTTFRNSDAMTGVEDARAESRGPGDAFEIKVKSWLGGDQLSPAAGCYVALFSKCEKKKRDRLPREITQITPLNDGYTQAAVCEALRRSLFIEYHVQAHELEMAITPNTHPQEDITNYFNQSVPSFEVYASSPCLQKKTLHNNIHLHTRVNNN